MKNAIIFTLFGALCLVSLIAATIEGQYPSDRIMEDSGVRKRAGDFLLGQHDDLRLLYCADGILDSRVSRRVVVFDVVGIPLEKNSRPIDKGEILIESEMTVRSLLNAVGMQEWEHGQPQFRLVQRDQIIQSPIGGGGDDPHRRLNKFLTTIVYPGDILVLAAVQ